MDQIGFSSSHGKKVKVEFIDNITSKSAELRCRRNSTMQVTTNTESFSNTFSGGLELNELNSLSIEEQIKPETFSNEVMNGLEMSTAEKTIQVKAFSNEVIFGSELFCPVVDSQEIQLEHFIAGEEVIYSSMEEYIESEREMFSNDAVVAMDGSVTIEKNVEPEGKTGSNEATVAMAGSAEQDFFSNGDVVPMTGTTEEMMKENMEIERETFSIDTMVAMAGSKVMMKKDVQSTQETVSNEDRVDVVESEMMMEEAIQSERETVSNEDLAEMTGSELMMKEDVQSFQETVSNDAMVAMDGSEKKIKENVEPNRKMLSNESLIATTVSEEVYSSMKEHIKPESKLFSNEEYSMEENIEPKANMFMFSSEFVYPPVDTVEIKEEPFDPIGVPSTSAMEYNNIEDTSYEPVAKRAFKKTDNIKGMWNMERIILDLQTEEQCIQFSEAVGLVPMEKECRRHRKNCTVFRNNSLGYFSCHKCRKKWSRAIGTWFEECHLPLPTVFRIMYCYAREYDYYTTQIECYSQARDKILSSTTISDWFTSCRETVVAYELDHMEKREKIGGEGKIVIVDEGTFGERKFAKGKEREGHWVLAMLDPISSELRLATCPVNEAFAEVQLPIIKHVEPRSIIHTSSWPAYEGLEVHGFSHKIVTGKKEKTEAGTSSSASEVAIQDRQMSNWSFLKKRFSKFGNHPGNFEDMLVEKMWRQTIRRQHLDPFVELLKAIKHVYKV